MARHLDLIGIGPGNPDWITLAAVKAIQSLDVLFVVLKEREVDDLVEFRREVLRRHRPDAEDPSAPHPLRLVELQDPPRPWQSTPDYPKAVATWRTQRLEQWTQAVEGALEDGQRGGFLVWGDPSLFESTLTIVNRLIAEVDSRDGVPIELNVIPGISSSLSLATRHQIALNRQGRAVQISPARLLEEGMPEGVDDVVVMLDGKQTFSLIDPTGLDIYWAAYIGSPDEILISGPLADVKDEILRVRAQAKEEHGWLFDTYLLRRR